MAPPIGETHDWPDGQVEELHEAPSPPGSTGLQAPELLLAEPLLELLVPPSEPELVLEELELALVLDEVELEVEPPLPELELELLDG
jgi:hypothetical protein